MKQSFRQALCDSLIENSENNSKIVIFNADSARALGMTAFKERFPDRIYCMGISEADMISTAAGMSTTDLIPVIIGFSMFVTEKPFEQIRQSIAYPNLNVKIIATHAGLCVGQDGATHQCLEDIAIMRLLPNFKVFVAADVNQERSAIKAMLEYDGPAYLRLGRDIAEDVYEAPVKVFPGGSDTLRSGKDVTIAACGLMVNEALKASDLLLKQGINASVINLYSIKPLDQETLLKQAESTGAFVTVEDHSVIAGLGSAVAELLSKRCATPIEFVGVQDQFGESGNQDELYEKYGLTAERIAEAAIKAIARKNSRG